MRQQSKKEWAAIARELAKITPRTPTPATAESAAEWLKIEAEREALAEQAAADAMALAVLNPPDQESERTDAAFVRAVARKYDDQYGAGWFVSVLTESATPADTAARLAALALQAMNCYGQHYGTEDYPLAYPPYLLVALARLMDAGDPFGNEYEKQIRAMVGL